MGKSNVRKMLLAGIGFCVALSAQQEKVEFDAVSIKPADPAATSRTGQNTNGTLRGRNLRLFELIMSAWHLNRNQIVGGPSWMDTAGWDVDARFPAGASSEVVSRMMQKMLADRFGLVTHRETRTLPTYTLTVAQSGTKLQRGDGRGDISGGPRLIRYSSGTMRDLVGQLSSYLGGQVIDRTGLTGQYAISLSFAPVKPGATESDIALESAPSIFQALQDQAGLKLESTKGPVEVLVIDRAEKPTGN